MKRTGEQRDKERKKKKGGMKKREEGRKIIREKRHGVYSRSHLARSPRDAARRAPFVHSPEIVIAMSAARYHRIRILRECSRPP